MPGVISQPSEKLYHFIQNFSIIYNNLIIYLSLLGFALYASVQTYFIIKKTNMTTRNYLCSLVIILLTTFYFACSKKSDQSRPPGPASSPALDDHVQSIMDAAAGAHPLKDRRFITSAGINTADWDLRTMERATYDHSEIKVYKCNSIKEKDRHLIVFEWGGRYLPALATVHDGAQPRRFTLSSLEGKVYYTFQVNAANRMGGLKILQDIPFYKLQDPAARTNGLADEELEDKPCPDKTDTFGSCMQCAYGECSSDWLCTVVCGLQFVYCSIGFALACAT